MLISNSRVNTFLTCQRREYYSFRERLQPLNRNYGKALTRGIVGHEALEIYYGAKQDGMPKEYCLNVAIEVVDKAIDDIPEFTNEFLQLQDVLRAYVDLYWDENWEVLDVEGQYESFLDNSTVEIKYGMRLDLLVKEGKDIILVDHKFVYNFFTEKELKMNSQTRKYIKCLRDNGINVKKAILNQIRYRELKNPNPEKCFKRTPVISSYQEIDNVVNEHNKVASTIYDLHQLPMAEHMTQTTMHIDKGTCTYCAFQPLCKDFLQGVVSTGTKEVLYQNNEYLVDYEKEKE